MMIKDHGAGREKLTALAASQNITLPDSVSKKQQKEKNDYNERAELRLMKLINMMVDDHKEDINEVEKTAANGTAPVIKTFAADNLKMLHVHLDSAMNI
jgi:putative membrane protein